MIHSTVQTPKFRKLVRQLRPHLEAAPVNVETIAVGILERMWHMAMSGAKRGDIGRFDNDDIAESVGWFGDADQLIEVLVSTGWVDECEQHRLVIHDWHEHAPRHIKQNIKRLGGFAGDVKQEPTVSGETLSGDQTSQTPRIGLTPNQTKPNLTKPVQTPSTAVDDSPAVEPPKQSADDKRFEGFWSVVHLRKGRRDAKRAFTRSVTEKARELQSSKDDAAKFIIEAMRMFAASPESRPEDHSPIHPTTWLNSGRYDDDRRTWQGSQTPSEPGNSGPKGPSLREQREARRLANAKA